MAEQAVPRRFDQALRAGGFGHAEAVLRGSLEKRNNQQRGRHHPDVLTQPRKASEAARQRRNPAGECRRVRAAEGIVYRKADDLRAQHVTERGKDRGQHAQHKQRLAASQEAYEQFSAVFLLRFSVHGRVETSFPYVGQSIWHYRGISR